MMLIPLAGALIFSTFVSAQPSAGSGTTVGMPAASKPVSAPAAAGRVESEDLSNGASSRTTFNYNNEDLVKVVEAYARLAGVKIVIDPSVRGHITILNPQPVTLHQAFEDLSLALSLESYGFSRIGDTLVLRPARSLQRGLIEVRTSLPSVKPERMVTYILKLKHLPVVGVNREMRNLLSKDGELVPDANSNSLIISDWTSNLQRVHDLMVELDVPANTKMAKKNASAPTAKEKSGP